MDKRYRPFDYAEFNRRLAKIVETPAGGYTPGYLAGLFGTQAMVQRPEWQPNGFYKVQSAWLLVLAAAQEDAKNWNSALTLYIRQSGSGVQTKTSIQFTNLPQGHPGDPASSGCLTQAELYDSAIAAGWECDTGMDR